MTRRYTVMILPIIGPRKDIPAPDVNTNPEIMGWMMDTVSMFEGQTVLDIVTGKSLDLGGSLGRFEATGRGCEIAALEAFKRMKIDPKFATAAVQGFGNVGSVAAYLLMRDGVKIVAASDVSGGYHNPNGLDIIDMLRFCQNKKGHTLEGYKGDGVERITNEELLELDVDLLLPAALERQITTDNADKIRAKLVVEGANGPTTPDADHILFDRGVCVVPDILANSGGVVVSYLEWVQGIQSFFWTEEQVNNTLRQVMVGAFDTVWEKSEDRKINLRTAAMMLAVDKVAKAMDQRGIFP
jgi:glutamate dehydrogenase (NAD(P)+)